MKEILEFLEKSKGAAEQLEGFEREIDDRRERLMGVIKGVERALELQVDSKFRGTAVQRRMDQIAKRLKGASKAWWEQVEEQVEQAEFVSLFDRSLIVMVYGKVNSGKSSLGNFVAGLSLAELPENPYGEATPRFRLHAEQDGELNSRDKAPGFVVGVTETTSEIQEFTIGGMSWVDSPGIHSMTRENETLAKKFVDAAELVVFLTNSDSPARKSDLQELEALVKAGKPVLIVVSKFDDMDEDIDPETEEVITIRRVHPPRVRQEQQAWLEEQIAEAGLDEALQNRRYCFVSTLVAEEAVKKGDQELFIESGMAEFYEQLGAILSQEAVEFKRQSPRRSFNRLVQEVIGQGESSVESSLDGLMKQVEETAAFIEANHEQLKGLAPRIASRTIAAAAPRVEGLIYQVHDEVEGLEKKEAWAQTEIEEQTTKIVEHHLRKELGEELARSMREVIRYSGGVHMDGIEIEIPPVEELIEEIEVSMKTVYARSGAAIGGAIGVAIGAFIGAPAGPGGSALAGIVGSTLLGGLGDIIGRKIAPTKMEQMSVGTNVEEVINKTLQELERKLEPAVKKDLQELGRLYFMPLERALRETRQRLDEAVSELLALRYAD